MGSRYKEVQPFVFYDPEQDRDGQRKSPRNRSAPLSPRAPVSPRAQPSGYAYPIPTSPRERPFGHYDPEMDGEREDRRGPEMRPSPSGVESRGDGRGAPGPPPHYINQDSGSMPMSHGYGGRGAPEPGYGGSGGPEAGYGGRGAPEPGYSGSGGPEPGYGGRGAPEPGYGGRGGREAGYGGRGVPEPGYGGRGAPVRPFPPSNQDFAGASGRGRGYGDGEPGYPRPGRPGQMEDELGHGRGRGSSVAPLGAGKYVYGGLQPERTDFEQDYETPPPPISSEYAHQAYASVFSDPVYGGAGQLNARAGYAEEPAEMQQLHHKEDVLRHFDQF